MLTHFRLMRGIVRLKSPLELNFEGISEIQKLGEDERDIHDFPMTTKFINMEITRSRAGTHESRAGKPTAGKNIALESSQLSLEKKKEELSKLFKEKARAEGKVASPRTEVSTPKTEKVERRRK